MKKYIVVSLFSIFILFFFAWLTGESVPQDVLTPPEEEVPEIEEAEPEKPPDTPIPTGEHDGAQMLRVRIGGEVREMDMGTYLVGVVRAEMPAVFEEEALKAQAVAARTYTLYKMAHGGSPNHPDADACDDINCCKAFMDEAAAAMSWGEGAAVYEEKIRAAVRSTDGECILYDGKPVLAVFHSSASGETLDAAEVWSESLPYLKSVSTPEDSETVPNYRSSASFTISALKAILKTALPEAALDGNPSDWFTNIRQKTTGAVTALDVGGVEVSGNKLRSVLGLRSPCFTIAFEGDSVVFSVTGYGHGVGMSQYGANVLAGDGMDYRDILAWYYTDTIVGVYPS